MKVHPPPIRPPPRAFGVHGEKLNSMTVELSGGFGEAHSLKPRRSKSARFRLGTFGELNNVQVFVPVASLISFVFVISALYEGHFTGNTARSV